MRLADIIQREPIRLPVWYGFKQHPRQEQIREAVRRAQVIVVDNVTEFFYAETTQEVFDLEKDFPDLTPPYPLFFMETVRPSAIRSIDPRGSTDVTDLPERWGAIFAGDSIEEIGQSALDQLEDSKQTQEAVSRLENLLTAMERGLSSKDRAQMEAFKRNPSQQALDALSLPVKEFLMTSVAVLEIKEGSGKTLFQRSEGMEGWILRAITFLYNRESLIYIPVHNLFLISKNGKAIGAPKIQVESTDNEIDRMYSLKDKEVLKGQTTFLYPFLLAISFMHGKDVKVIHNQPPSEVSKAYEKRYGKPLVEYKSLIIDYIDEISRLKLITPQGGLA